MKRIIMGTIIGLAVGGAITWTLLRHGEGAATKTEEHKEESRVQRGTNGEVFLKLNQETQQHVGLKVAVLESAQLKPEAKGYGRVLDPALLATAVADMASARVALEASRKEYERLKILHAQDQNASTRALEAADAAAKRDQILADTAQARLVATWGKAVASLPDLPAFVHSLILQEAALVRIDLPLGEAVKAPPTGARLAPLAAPDNPTEAQFLGPTPNADPATQGQGFLCLLKENPPPPGAAMVGWLAVPGEVQSGVIVPRDALIRHEGEEFVYLQSGDETFQRKEIALERPAPDGWFVTGGLKPQDKVVIVGAQQLLSEELKGRGGEE